MKLDIVDTEESEHLCLHTKNGRDNRTAVKTRKLKVATKQRSSVGEKHNIVTHNERSARRTALDLFEPARALTAMDFSFNLSRKTTQKVTTNEHALQFPSLVVVEDKICVTPDCTT